MNERVIELAKKLKALADRGIGGERNNAIKMLEKLMAQHAITMDMINENDAKDHPFVVDKLSRKFFVQTVANVVGRNGKFGQYVKAPRNKLRFYVTCTPAEAIEIQAKFDFFYTAWEKELEIFYSAFIQKNQLYSKPTEGDEHEDKDLTQEELRNLAKMLSLMKGMTRHIFTKQITNKK